ncbi:MAG: hypothetical protein JNJ45_01465 [Chthonomonas sp.]|nr:hypothetical protein [Chthonomonas sp.]
MTLAWPHSDGIEADIAVSPSGHVAAGQWAEVLNPFGRAHAAGTDLNQAIESDPAQGAELLASLIADTKREIALAIAQGAIGIAYRLVGAAPAHCTPMQFGGHYLEEERELLAEVGVPVLVFVEGEDIYFEFVSDLPSAYMGWDVTRNQLTLAEARTYREGAFALAADDADLKIVGEAA